MKEADGLRDQGRAGGGVLLELTVSQRSNRSQRGEVCQGKGEAGVVQDLEAAF